MNEKRLVKETVLFSIVVILLIGLVLFSDGTITGMFAYTNSTTTYLGVWDDTDSIVKYQDNIVVFYANYTNLTSGTPLNFTNSGCNITIGGIENPMVYDSLSELYKYNRTFSSAGTQNFSVTCFDDTFDTLTATDEFTINDRYNRQITDCQIINDYGTYYLTQEIINSSVSHCFNIQSSNVVIDCQGHLVDGISEGASRAVSASNLQNITLKNCNFSDWGSTFMIFTNINNSIIQSINSSNVGNEFIRLTNSNYNNLSDVTCAELTKHCFELRNSSNNIIENNVMRRTQVYGIRLQPGSHNNIIRNNIITGNEDKNEGILIVDSANNSAYNNYITRFGYHIHIKGATSTGNTFNITKTLGTNIVYGAYRGGNFFGKYTGTDGDGDGIGDTPYKVHSSLGAPDAYDYLPLVSHCFDISEPKTYTLTSNKLSIRAPGDCINIYSDNATLDCQGYSLSRSMDYPFVLIHIMNVNNVTVKNCPMPIDETYYTDIYVRNSTNSIIQNILSVTGASVDGNCQNITIKDSEFERFIFEGSDSLLETLHINEEFQLVGDRNTIRNSEFISGATMTLIAPSAGLPGTPSGGCVGKNNTIYNNKFQNENSKPECYHSPFNNKFNTDYNCSAGLNIIGGDCMGGNYWIDAIGKIFDLDGDHIGDDYYIADYYPLLENSAPSTARVYSISTNSLTNNNVSAVEFYDASGESWICNASTSWYAEKGCFPEETLLIGHEDGFDIIDLSTEELWMNFVSDHWVNWPNFTFIVVGSPRIAAKNGLIVLSGGDDNGLWVVDFPNDNAYMIHTDGTLYYASSGSSILNISQRAETNDGSYTVPASGLYIVNTNVNDVTIEIIDGKTYVVAPSDGGVSVLNLDDRTSTHYGGGWKSNNAFFDADGNVYYDSTNEFYRTNKTNWQAGDFTEDYTSTIASSVKNKKFISIGSTIYLAYDDKFTSQPGCSIIEYGGTCTSNPPSPICPYSCTYYSGNDDFILQERASSNLSLINSYDLTSYLEGETLNEMKYENGNFYFATSGGSARFRLSDQKTAVHPLNHFPLYASDITSIATGSMYLSSESGIIQIKEIPDQTWASGTRTNAFDLDDYFSDLDGDTITYTVHGNDHFTVNIDSQNRVSFTPDYDWTGTDTMYFTASDGTDSTKSTKFFVTVTSSTPRPAGTAPSGGGGGMLYPSTTVPSDKDALEIDVRNEKEFSGFLFDFYEFTILTDVGQYSGKLLEHYVQKYVYHITFEIGGQKFTVDGDYAEVDLNNDGINDVTISMKRINSNNYLVFRGLKQPVKPVEERPAVSEDAKKPIELPALKISKITIYIISAIIIILGLSIALVSIVRKAKMKNKSIDELKKEINSLNSQIENKK